MVFGLIVLGAVVLAAITYVGSHRYDEELEVLDRRERCVAIAQSPQPGGADDAQRSQLAQCRSEGWVPEAVR
ncbi:hypothetical protein ASG43_17810 [Aureimonas sp. Leaf454]|nr:hypothetical protein ASG43_17810 [Aureimonas sp. Leaf454]